MRLLNTSSLEFQNFFDHTAVPYAILSHTWGQDEIIYEEMLCHHLSQDSPYAFALLGRQPRQLPGSQGFDKIKHACAQAQRDGLSHIWIDTCCIDKRSSAELSEAINSMFMWYARAQTCYAFLADVDESMQDVQNTSSTGSPTRSYRKGSFRGSRWFSRGWTLQELLAPSKLAFYNANWQLLGTRSELAKLVADATPVHLEALLKTKRISDYSVAQRMSWAARRQTTREEDMAYALLGIFGINMPLLYGEGSKAFMRLQEEIIRNSDDSSIFAWSSSALYEDELLAPSPDAFAGADKVVRQRDESADRKPYDLNNLGLRITLPVYRSHAILDCGYEGQITPIALPLTAHSSAPHTFVRIHGDKLSLQDVALDDLPKAEVTTITILRGLDLARIHRMITFRKPRKVWISSGLPPDVPLHFKGFMKGDALQYDSESAWDLAEDELQFVYAVMEYNEQQTFVASLVLHAEVDATTGDGRSWLRARVGLSDPASIDNERKSMLAQLFQSQFLSYDPDRPSLAEGSMQMADGTVIQLAAKYRTISEAPMIELSFVKPGTVEFGGPKRADSWQASQRSHLSVRRKHALRRETMTF